MGYANASTGNDVWLPKSLTDTAPANAVEARLVFLFMQDNNSGGAIYIDDVSFTNLDLEFDADGDGDVDGSDFLAWQKNVGLDEATSVAKGDFNYDGVVDSEDLAVWQNATSPLSHIASAQVPEPTCLILLSASLVAPLAAGTGSLSPSSKRLVFDT